MPEKTNFLPNCFRVFIPGPEDTDPRRQGQGPGSGPTAAPGPTQTGSLDFQSLAQVGTGEFTKRVRDLLSQLFVYKRIDRKGI